jgi:1-acyl-sn-glycerol-3-phosphate acyltransferase
MKKILAYPLSVIFAIFFFLHLIIFHPLQWLAIKIGGAKWQRQVVTVLNFFLLADLLFLGIRTKLKNRIPLPKNRPVIIVSNHQSMFDIPLIIWYLRKLKPKFISKKSLGKGIPSISFNLRHGGNALIDRKDPEQSIPTLKKFGKFIAEQKFAATIFPEGTRSRDGKPKKFAQTGLKILFEQMPDALILPVTIHNSWKLFQYGKFPLGIGFKMELELHPFIELNEMEEAALLKQVETQIKSAIKY